MDATLQDLLSTALKSGLTQQEVKKILQIKPKTQTKFDKQPTNYRYYAFVVAVIAVLLVAGAPKVFFRKPIEYMSSYVLDTIYDPESLCLITHGAVTIELTRPLANCKMCRGLTEIPEVYNMTKERFKEEFAYSGKPVLIKNGTGNWTALRIFSYRYFKLLYTKLDALDQFDEEQCQFFGYKTNLRTLKHVFKMSKDRAALKKDQWYVGWSNCLPNVQKILRKHYDRPTFLPDDSESSSLDWIFMGGSGNGALMHIDSVNRPSWQAMVKGKKTWYFEPPPECEIECPGARNLSATMEPGDILVADTNRWYHSTFIHPGDMAITIGSEYD